MKVTNPKKGNQVVAIACADIHLCLTPPPARKNEPDWFATMKRPLDQLRKLSSHHKAPIIYAGDIFDSPRPSLELVNWALEHLPPGFAVPGNHDLPHHSYDEIKKSAYWTMCLHGKIHNLEPGKATAINDIVLYGFPCDFPVTPCPEPIKEFALQVAVIHAYIWQKGYSYQGATQDSYLKSWYSRLKGYEVAIFGDNHIHFHKDSVWNCGSLMRRRIDQRDYQPSVGLICANGMIDRFDLDCSDDIFCEEAKESKEGSLDLSSFVEGVDSLGDVSLDFPMAIQHGLEDSKVRQEVKTVVLKCLEGVGK